MPDTSIISPFKASLGGGLTLNKDVFAMHPGEALQLVNFEPDITGGYRRLNGTTLFNSNIVPQVSSATERIMMSAIFNDLVIAGRGGTVYTGTTSGSWTSRATSKGTAYTYDFDKFNYGSGDKIIIATGSAGAFTLNTSYTEDIINATGGGTAPTNPKFVKSFANHMFYAGMSDSKAEIIFSVPFQEDNFTSGSGAGSFSIGVEVTGMKVFRDELFIFGESSIYKLAGKSSSDFALAEVAKNVGTLAHHSIQEIGGDNVTATIIRNKSQYRLFYPKTGGLESSQKGLIAVIKTNPNTNQMGYEYSDIKGMKVASCDSELISNVETTISGGYDGYVYKQDSGNVFTRGATTANIDATYRSPDITMGDPGIRKTMQRVNLNWKPEGAVSASLFVIYNYADVNTPQPNVFSLSTSGSGAIFGVGLFGTAAFGQGDLPITRQTVEGSGFAVAVKITDTSNNIPFSLKGFQLEFTPGGRA